MTGDCHVQFWESARVKFPRATQLQLILIYVFQVINFILKQVIDCIPDITPILS